MVFSSMEFLFRFLPIFLVAYFLTKKAYRNITLLIGSLIFYAYGEPVYVLLMIGSILVNHFIARRIQRFHSIEKASGIDCSFERKAWLVAALVIDFGLLFLFKYVNFFIGVANNIAGRQLIKEVALTLPLGISFYTFQITSYIIDVYRKKIVVLKSSICFATYVCMFPQLIAGPIINYPEIRPEMQGIRKANLKQIEWGVTEFIVGLAYKVLLANKIASLWNDVQMAGAYGINTATAWLGSWGYSMQILFDFMGYSLMAMGLGAIMGFRFPVNFKDPYCAVSMTDFWRRWHITLGRWFREYVYIPMGGNRKGFVRMVWAMFVVWVLTGLWHGADWNFLIWGLFLFAVLFVEKLFLGKVLDKVKILGHLYMLFMIPLSWTIFNISKLDQLKVYLKRMFGMHIDGSVVIDGMARFKDLLGTYWWLLLICVVCCTPLPYKLICRFYRNYICKIILLVLFWYSVYQIALGGNNPFLYFRF